MQELEVCQGEDTVLFGKSIWGQPYVESPPTQKDTLEELVRALRESLHLARQEQLENRRCSRLRDKFKVIMPMDAWQI